MSLVVGDIHGEFGYLNSLIHKKQPTVILQVGELGYWPKFRSKTQIKSPNTKIYFCDGNHEDHDSLKTLENNEVYENVYYMKRGSTLDLPDGRTVLFMGGAFSIDWEHRTPGIDWFPFEELVTEEDINKIPDKKIDIVISHTAPKEFYISNIDYSIPDPSRECLSQILEKYHPKLWYFGHFHSYMNGFDYGCKWTGLAHPRSGYRWWVGLDLCRIE